VPIRAITLDLDDTLWPFAPVAIRIQAALEGWLSEFAPMTAARFDPAAAHDALMAVRRERPHLEHRPADLRREALRRMLDVAGEDPELADAALAVVMQARQQVDLYPDVAPALDRLAARFPLVAVTNGNADLEHTGVARWFTDVVYAADVGVGKPDRRVFDLACERLGLPPEEVLHAGDDLVLDVGGALAAGLQAAWVHRDLAGEAPDGALRFLDMRALADALEAPAEDSSRRSARP
jgi:putative hydrolase of the HAD superfamily